LILVLPMFQSELGHVQGGREVDGSPDVVGLEGGEDFA
jgi:hypothetical protein